MAPLISRLVVKRFAQPRIADRYKVIMACKVESTHQIEADQHERDSQFEQTKLNVRT